MTIYGFLWITHCLCVKRRAAWQKNQVLRREEIKKRIKREPQVLREKLRNICGDEFEINIKCEGECVIAEVDGLLFVSDLRDPFFLSWPIDLAEKKSAVKLWWECDQCFGHEQSGMILHDYQLGEQLESFKAESSHSCKEGHQGVSRRSAEKPKLVRRVARRKRAR